MKFKNYFNPYNPDHINAYLHLVKTGTWPDNFGDDLDQSDRVHWNIWAVSILADAWLDYFEWKQKSKIEFIPK
jgi:hypothetical protein